jgi:hypothetical protein
MGVACQDRRMSNVSHTAVGEVVIRPATPADADDLRRLAALDSARALFGTVLVAESDGQVRAAYSMDQRRGIADPFVASAGLVALLETRARLLRGGREARSGRLGRLRLLPARS